MSPDDQEDRTSESPASAKTLIERVTVYAAFVLIVIAVCVGFCWLVLHEILDAIDSMTGLVASFSFGGLVTFGLAWALLLDRLGVIKLDEDT